MSITNSSPGEVRPLVLATLMRLGWVECIGGPALATKSFQTAVGPKAAIIWLGAASEETHQHALSIEFQSEGRNALSNFSSFIGRDLPPEAIEGHVTSFAEDAEVAIGETYAVRLHHLNPAA